MSSTLSPTPWQHAHTFDEGNAQAERKTRWAVLLTVAMMVVEIAGGYVFSSMALLADGWHMATHAAALGIAALAYLFARRQAGNSHFTFGTASSAISPPFPARSSWP